VSAVESRTSEGEQVVSAPVTPAGPVRAPSAIAAAPSVALASAIGNQAFGRYLARRRLLRQPSGVVNAYAERELDARWTIKRAQISAELAARLLAKPRITVAFYEAYETGSTNDAEFKGAGTDFAKTYGTLGLISSDSGATLTESAPIAIKNRDDLAQALTAIHQTLHALAYDRASAQGGSGTVETPVIGTIAIFAHGVRRSLGLDPEGETGAHWFRANQIDDFAGAIRPHVPSDVRVLLFACSTGASEKESYAMPPPDGAGGAGSFAAQLANALGGSATVYAHDVAAHTESNPLARVFTAGSETGRDVFNVLYDAQFIASEVARVKADRGGLVGGAGDQKLADGLRSQMWDHYSDAVSNDFARINTKNRHFTIGGYGGVGAAMFVDPTGTAAVLQNDFRTVWLTDERIRKLAK
jgi:hypothetical protein